ncbi:MAG TPA: flagellar basal-body rod protein FlgF [Gammaproteobacteria bacterium]|nr:flagellar basal-body rod protein FlgF [Gammaproteobacteria bacterium]
MDRMVFTSMTGAMQAFKAQSLHANNLANSNTTGFKADLQAFRSAVIEGPGFPTRNTAVMQSAGTDFRSGPLRTTGRDLDMAIEGDGWFVVENGQGQEALTRAGNFHLDPFGVIRTASGEALIGNGGPIAIPPAESMSIAHDGTISIKPLGSGPDTSVVLDRIKLVNPPMNQLRKDENGLVSMADTNEYVPDSNVRIAQGMVEMSNVQAVESMVNMIAMQRHFEMQIKAMDNAEELDRSSTALMRFS